MGRPLMLAFGSCFGIGSLLFLLVYFISGKDAHLAEGLGALPLIGVHHLAESFDKRATNAQSSPTTYAQGYTFAKYLIPWQLMTLGAVAAMCAVVIGASTITFTLISLFVQGDMSGKLGSISFIGNVWPECIAAYFIGRWIGIRSDRFGFYIAVGYPIIGTLILRGTDFSMLSKADFQQVFGDGDMNFGTFVGAAVGGYVPFGLFGLIGFWRGRLAQQTQYVSHLLKLLPKATRDVLLSMLYEEVGRIPAPAKSAPPTPAPAHGAA